jgi:hypothetical protein
LRNHSEGVERGELVVDEAQRAGRDVVVEVVRVADGWDCDDVRSLVDGPGDPDLRRQDAVGLGDFDDAWLVRLVVPAPQSVAAMEKNATNAMPSRPRRASLLGGRTRWLFGVLAIRIAR